ncbi:Hypothetical predicted protein [Octopus vulgaris]|uniref:Uncharacterized protein n=1 Tax=Octopus vulgaris TaxID=6645 RepID=A0AA36B954_OCTVU|nr:Hypothetical predicted protein [Octopus vulgaris]
MQFVISCNRLLKRPLVEKTNKTKPFSNVYLAKCAIPGYDNDTYKIQSESHEELINEYIPKSEDEGEVVYEKCLIYSNTTENGNRTTQMCSSWVYDKTNTHTSITSQGGSHQWMLTASSILGRMFSTAAFGIVFLYTLELYPTCIRNGALGTMSTFARVGGALAPYTLNFSDLVSGKVGRILPMVLMGALSIIAGLLSLLLPETNNRKMMDNFRDLTKSGQLELVGSSSSSSSSKGERFGSPHYPVNVVDAVIPRFRVREDMRSLERIDKVMEDRKKMNFAAVAGDKEEKIRVNEKEMQKYKEMLKREGHEVQVSYSSVSTGVIN